MTKNYALSEIFVEFQRKACSNVLKHSTFVQNCKAIPWEVARSDRPAQRLTVETFIQCRLLTREDA